MENKEIANIIVQLTDKLGITVSEVTKIFIDAQQKLAMVDIIMLLFVITTTIAVSVFTLKLIHKNKKEERPDSKVSITDEDIIMPTAIVTFITILFCLVISTLLVTALYRLVAPEYMGIKDMISTFIP